MLLIFAFPVKCFVVQVIHNWLRDEAIFFVLLVGQLPQLI